MTTMTHSVIARDEGNNILAIITCFNENQIPIAKRSIEKDYPHCKFTIKSSPEDYNQDDARHH